MTLGYSIRQHRLRTFLSLQNFQMDGAADAKLHFLIQGVHRTSYASELFEGKREEEFIKIQIPGFLPSLPESESLGGGGTGNLYFNKHPQMAVMQTHIPTLQGKPEVEWRSWATSWYSNSEHLRCLTALCTPALRFPSPTFPRVRDWSFVAGS